MSWFDFKRARCRFYKDKVPKKGELLEKKDWLTNNMMQSNINVEIQK